MNDYFQDDGNPPQGGQVQSSPIRALMASVEAGFDKLCTLTGNGGKTVKVNSGGTALEVSKVTITEPATSATLTIPNGVTLTGPAASGIAATLAGTETLTNKTLTSPTLTTPALGTPASGVLTNCTGTAAGLSIGGNAATATSATTAAAVTNGGALNTPATGTLTNCTGLPISSGVSGLGTGVATAAAVNIGSAGAAVVNGGVLGTPASGTLTSCTGLPVSTGVSGFGVGVATFLATPSSANLASAVTGETGTGALVFATSPTLVTPELGVATCTSLSTSGATGGDKGANTVNAAAYYKNGALISAMPLVQNVTAATSAVATGTTITPYDNSIPQITEGDEYMSCVITPQKATNRLEITVNVATLGTTGAVAQFTLALHQDAIANALAAVSMAQAAGGFINPNVLSHEMTAGTTSAITFRVRIGSAVAGTTTFNGNSGARIYGGVAASKINIKEYDV